MECIRSNDFPTNFNTYKYKRATLKNRKISTCMKSVYNSDITKINKA